MKPVVVLDTSALLAWLWQEPGWERVDAAFTRMDCRIGTVNWAELVSKLTERIADEGEARHLLAQLPATREDFGETDAFDCGWLRTPTRALGLSLGDRACLALARRLGAVALTADRSWLKLDLGVTIECIRPDA